MAGKCIIRRAVPSRRTTPRTPGACPMEKRIYRTRIRGGFMKMRLTTPVAAQGCVADRGPLGRRGGPPRDDGLRLHRQAAPRCRRSSPRRRRRHPGRPPSRRPGPRHRPAAGPRPRGRPRPRSSASARSSATRRASASGSPRASAPAPGRRRRRTTRAARPSAAPAHSTIPYPTAAPETGGGGTAGLQDGLLFGIGGAAVLAGIGFLAYRRRLARKFAGPAQSRETRRTRTRRTRSRPSVSPPVTVTGRSHGGLAQFLDTLRGYGMVGMRRWR